MHIRTPRRYRGQRRNLIASRTILMLIIIGLLAGTGVYMMQNMTILQPMAYELIGTAIIKVQDQAMTIAAPTATATPDPRNDLINANNFWERGSVSEALRLYMPMLPSVPNDVDVHYRVALGMIIQGSFNEAVEYGEMTVSANPLSSDAWAIRAWALDWETGHTGEAIASALQAKDLNPKNARAWAYLAEAYFSAGQGKRAFDTADTAINLDPNSPEAYRARGVLSWFINGDADSALKDLNQAYELAANSNPALAGLIAVDIAGIEVGNKNITGAVDMLKKVLEVNPDNTQALLQMGVIQMNQNGDPSQGSSFLQRCVDIAPENIDCNYQLGRAQAKIDNQMPAAAESFARAIQLGSKRARHYWWAAQAQISLGNCSKAIEYLEPGYQYAKDENNTELMTAFEEIMPECGLNSRPSVAPAATAEATTDPSA